MKFDYKVKYNGKWYLPGEEIEESEISDSSAFEKHFTKTDINRMPVLSLRKMASEIGLKSSESMNGSELKEYIINALGL